MRKLTKDYLNKYQERLEQNNINIKFNAGTDQFYSRFYAVVENLDGSISDKGRLLEKFINDIIKYGEYEMLSHLLSDL